MKVLIAGSSGFIGSEIVAALGQRGYEVVRLVRSEDQLTENTLLWDPKHHEINLEDFEGFDVVINLAGENIASSRWSDEKKKKIKESRVMGTHMLCELLARLQYPPKLLINASAVGIYGDRGAEELTEESLPGTGFLPKVCQKWEEATDPAKERGIRVVKMRIGVVLHPKGGALAKMLLPFKLGLGGVIGSGDQYISWISLDDLVGAFLFVIRNESMQGAVNVVAPEPVSNRTYTKILGKVLNRPTIFPLPAFVAKLVMGEMATETVLSSTRVIPKKLEQAGYEFLYPDLEGALKHLLD